MPAFAAELDGLRDKVVGVVGDFDSIAEEDGTGVMRIGLPSQDANDMFKCLAVLKEAAMACMAARADGSAADLSAQGLATAAMRCLGLEPVTDKTGSPAAATDQPVPTIGCACAKALTQGRECFDVIVLGGLGGRFDHEAQSLNALVVW